jgi:hypothetical protein
VTAVPECRVDGRPRVVHDVLRSAVRGVRRLG